MTNVRFSIALSICAAIAFAATPSVDAGLVDSLCTPDGLIGGGDYAPPPDSDGYCVHWDIAQNNDGTWHYIYTFLDQDDRELSPATSHFIIQLSENIDPEEDLFNFSGDIEEDPEFGAFGPGSGNPGFPTGESIFGMKINLAGDQLSVEFDSTRQPMWGDFYAKGGSSSFAYNADLGVDVANPNDYNGTPVDDAGAPLAKVLVPDTLVPEPGTLALLAAAAFLRRSRRRTA